MNAVLDAPRFILPPRQPVAKAGMKREDCPDCCYSIHGIDEDGKKALMCIKVIPMLPALGRCDFFTPR